MINLTDKQRQVLLMVWPLISGERRPNCNDLLRHAKVVDPARWRHWAQLRHYLLMLKKHGIVLSRTKGNAVLWEPGPMSDWLQEQGVLR